MRLLEYQAKEIFRQHNLKIPLNVLCRKLADFENTFTTIGDKAVLKAQVPSGKRGKGGGIKVAENMKEGKAYAESMFGSEVCGFIVDEILIEETVQIDKEYYLSIITDTESQYSCPMILFTTSGGMEIEELLSEHPEKLHRIHVDPRYGLMDFQIRRLMYEANVDKDIEGQLTSIIKSLYEIYWQYDAEIAEINPLCQTSDNQLVALDGKITIDGNATFRHKDLEGAKIDTAESRAAAKGLSYVELEGNIGIISNGAGLTMATMDQIAIAGGSVANFMDTGERILRDGIADGLNILAQKSGLSSILINVFGGGVRCDVIAEKINEAMVNRREFSIPVIVCLQGRNADEGRRLISESNHPAVQLVYSLEEAVAKVTKLGGQI